MIQTSVTMKDHVVQRLSENGRTILDIIYVCILLLIFTTLHVIKDILPDFASEKPMIMLTYHTIL